MNLRIPYKLINGSTLARVALPLTVMSLLLTACADGESGSAASSTATPTGAATTTTTKSSGNSSAAATSSGASAQATAIASSTTGHVRSSSTTATSNAAATANALTPSNSSPVSMPVAASTSNFIDGTGIGGDTLANSEIGGPYPGDRAFRFRATSTGSITSTRLYLVFGQSKSGYSAGDGGVLTFEIQADDNTSAHLPSGKVLATTQLSHPLAGTPPAMFPLISFAAPAAVVAGNFYHLVMRNTAADVANNFLSVNTFMITRASSSTAVTQPRFGAQEWDELYKPPSGNWMTWQQYFSTDMQVVRTPIAQFNYASGQVQGQPYMESAIQPWGPSLSCGGVKAISAASQARQTYTHLSGARRGVEVAFRVKRNFSQSGDVLQLTIEDGSGNVLRQATTSIAAIAANEYDWIKFAIVPAFDLTAQAKYRFRLSAPASSSVLIFPIRKGTSTNDPNNMFSASLVSTGRAEFTSGGNWAGWDQWCSPDRSDFDHQYYITSRN